MEFDRNAFAIYDQNHRAFDTVVGAYVCWQNALRTRAGSFLGFEFVDTWFVRLTDEAEFVIRLSH